MKIVRTLGSLGLILSTTCLMACSTAAAEQPWQTIVIGQQTESQQLATRDLKRYLAQVGRSVPRVIDAKTWQSAPCPAVLVGTTKDHPLLAKLAGVPDNLGEEGYYLANETVAGKSVVAVAAHAPMGVVHGIYGLLRELRFGLFLGSESVPDSLPDQLPASSLVRKPAFAVRGVLPWYNFFDSPTAWDTIDHRTFVDQLIRSGANFLGFHTYDAEPFAAYDDHGTMRLGERLLNTGQSTWGTHPMPTSEFAYGSNQLFADDYFGAASTRAPVDRNQAIRQEQDILRDALDYAHRRGLKTCLGFEVSADPTQSSERETFLRRLSHVIEQYPTLDYLWIWQPEAQGVLGFAQRSPQDGALDWLAAARRDVFRRIVERTTGEQSFLQKDEAGKHARAREAARLEQYARLALRAMAHRSHAPKLVISGWGGDDRLLSAEYYEGLDKLLPTDVVFSSLDFISPRPRVDQIYNELPPRRIRWPIPWMENDGDQWHPQPFVHIYERMMDVAQQGGSQGILGIHWRTRDIEENFAYLVDRAWQPGLTAKEFYAQLATRTYPPGIVTEMADLLEELDALGYRWIGGSGQVECGGFAWSVSEEPKARRLEELRAKAAAILPRAGSGKARLEWLLGVMDWILAFRKVNLAALEVESLLARHKPREALAVMDKADLGAALRAYASRLSTRGEHGVLATINTKAVFAWRELRKACLAASGSSEPPAAEPSPSYPDRIVLPRLIGSVAEGKDLELMPIVLGGKPAWLHYRTLGTCQWTSHRLENVRGWVRRAAIPARDLASPGIEFAFSFADSPQQPLAWGPAGVSVLPATAPQPPVTAQLAVPAADSAALKPICRWGARIPFELKWKDVPEADSFRVLRDGQVIGEVATAFFPDAPTKAAPSHEYRVEAYRNGTRLAHGSVVCKSPDMTVAEDIPLKIRVRQDGISLRWPAASSLQIASYQVSRHKQGQPRQTLATLPASRIQLNRLPVKMTDGRWIFEVAALNQAGNPGVTGKIEVAWPPEKIKLARLDLPLDRQPTGTQLAGEVTFGPSGAHLDGGYLEMAHQPSMELEEGMTLEFEFTADRTDNMPVLLSHGRWQEDGWFVQILGRQLIIRTSAGDAVGPLIEAGKPYRIQWTFDGAAHRLRVNEADLFVDRPLSPRDCQRVLRIGQYDVVQPEYAFHGTIRKIRLEAPVTTD